MNNETGKKTPAEKPPVKKKSVKKTTTTQKSEAGKKPSLAAIDKPLLIVNLIFLSLLLLAVVYVWYDSRQSADKMQMEQASTISKLEQQLQNLDGTMQGIRTELKQNIQQQQTLTDAVNALSKEQPDSNRDWALMEVENLIVIAMHRLALEYDVNTALVALETADNRLKDMAEPELLPIREQLAIDMNALRAAGMVDVNGIALSLADFIGRVTTLPLQGQDALKADTPMQSDMDDTGEKGWRDLPALIWQELKGMVVIKRTADAGSEFLLPEQRYYLHENLRLELANAKYTVLRRDDENFHASIEIVIGWLQQHFESGSAAVSGMLETLQHMQSINIKPKLPDISSSLETLRAYQRMQNHDQDGG